MINNTTIEKYKFSISYLLQNCSQYEIQIYICIYLFFDHMGYIVDSRNN